MHVGSLALKCPVQLTVLYRGVNFLALIVMFMEEVNIRRKKLGERYMLTCYYFCYSKLVKRETFTFIFRLNETKHLKNLFYLSKLVNQILNKKERFIQVWLKSGEKSLSETLKNHFWKSTGSLPCWKLVYKVCKLTCIDAEGRYLICSRVPT